LHTIAPLGTRLVLGLPGLTQYVPSHWVPIFFSKEFNVTVSTSGRATPCTLERFAPSSKAFVVPWFISHFFLEVLTVIDATSLVVTTAIVVCSVAEELEIAVGVT